MKAAIIHAAGEPFALEDVDLSNPLPGEVRIRVAASGLCHSDYTYAMGARACPLPALFGHEASGIVEAVGEDVADLRPGDRVAAAVPYCGACRECQDGHAYRCDARPARAGAPRITWRGQPVFQFVELGAFAETLLVDRRSVVRLPDAMPLDLAALLSCAVISGVGAVVSCAKLRPGQTAAVIGCGGVGLNAIQGARIAGASRIVAVDVNPAKLALARTLGATDTVIGGPDAAAEVMALTGGGVDYALEAAGLKQTIRQAVLMLRKGGAAVLIGIPAAGTETALPIDAMFRGELRVLSSITGSSPAPKTIAALAGFYLDGRLQLEPLVSERIALADINRGYEWLAAGETARSLITFDAAA